MDKKPDDRIIIWEGDLGNQPEENPKVYAAAILDDTNAGIKSETIVSRSGFLTWIAAFLSLIGLTGCAVFLGDKGDKGSFVRRQRYQYCKCVPVCVCDMVCTCNLVSGIQKNIKKTEEQFTTIKDAKYVCKCVPVCTCDLVCTCNIQCTCQNQGRGRTICTCNPYWYPT